MIKAPLVDRTCAARGEVDLPEQIFGVAPNAAVVHEVLAWQLAARHLGTHSTKTRGEVRGGGRKPWRQKGTGRARHGSRRSPLWGGGGITFGPRAATPGYAPPPRRRRAGGARPGGGRAQSGPGQGGGQPAGCDGADGAHVERARPVGAPPAGGDARGAGRGAGGLGR